MLNVHSSLHAVNSYLNKEEQDTATHCSTLAWRVPQTEEPTGRKGSGTTERPHKQTKWFKKTHKQTKWFKKTHLTQYLTNSKQTNKQKTTNALVPELLKLRPCGSSSDHTQPGAQECTNDQRCKLGLSTGWQAQIQKRRNQSTETTELKC